jgi:NTE family protein
VVAGIIEVLGRRPEDPPPFRIFSGTSVGAINAVYFAAHADRGDLHIDELVRVWGRLQLSTHLRFQPRGMLPDALRLPGLDRFRSPAAKERYGPALLDPAPFEELIRNTVNWGDLHSNVRRGLVRAVIVAALDLDTGITTVFAETAPDVDYRPSRDPHRSARSEPITANHVLASAAIPVLFPSRKVGRRFYCDGGLRFNTPMAPALRVGADRMVVVSLLHEEDPERRRTTPGPEGGPAMHPGLVFLAGKLLNALLLDRIAYDLHVLERFNALIEVLHQTLTPQELARVDSVISEIRGTPYRIIKPLVFAPTQDIGFLAGERLRSLLGESGAGKVLRWLLSKTAMPAQGRWEADWASYLLFDGPFCRQLIELGREDVRARADEVREFFAP